MSFNPIAIVGRACVLPEAFTPDAFWQNLADARDLVTQVDTDRWRADALHASNPADRALHARGGYVRGFAQHWNPDGFALKPEELRGFDQLSLWALHCAREALRAAKSMDGQTRVGCVLGNLGFPSEAMSSAAECIWLGNEQAPHARRALRMSGGTADLIKRALALNGESFCIDAACASSLYAIKLACDQLHAGHSDVMLAGAVQRADDLFLHVGFTALKALSASGQSRPFHADADGLVPAEGAVMFALKRLHDARAAGDHIIGVIRGIGLSNDGRGKGLLVPDQNGQYRAMRQAYQQAGIAPEQIELLECHATGTTIGDATEIQSSAQLFAGHEDLPIGSLKSNLGHLITAAGGAALLKVLGSFEHNLKPATLHCETPNNALKGTPFRLLQSAEHWIKPAQRARIAAVSAFGFGGNNAHLIVSEDHASISDDSAAAQSRSTLALVALHKLTNDAQTQSFNSLTLDLDGLRMPPLDIERCLPQQLAIYSCVQAALRELPERVSKNTRTAVLIGMEPDTEIARFGLRWRHPELQGDAIVSALTSAAVLGTMPNIPANRISSQLDYQGPSFTVQSNARSGLDAINAASRMLLNHEIDLAIVGAVELAALGLDSASSTDACGAIVLMRNADASALDLETIGELPCPLRFEPHADNQNAASGLLELINALEREAAGMQPDGTADMSAVSTRVPHIELPAIVCFAGLDRAELLANLKSDTACDPGLDQRPLRVCFLANDSTRASQRERAILHIEEQAPGAGIYVGTRLAMTNPQNSIAFAFAGAGASYSGMGKQLLAELPHLKNQLLETAPVLCQSLSRAWQDDFEHADPSAQLCAASALSQIHLCISQDALQLTPAAWLGYSSGETNALFASGAWRDADAMMHAMDTSGLMRSTLCGEFTLLDTLWQPSNRSQVPRFASWALLCDVATVTGLLQQHHAEWPWVRLIIIESDEQCLIAGDATQCQALIAKIGAQRALPLSYALVVHMPEVKAVEAEWHAVHFRKTYPVRAGRLYSSASGFSYDANDQNCAQAILAQAVDTLDLRKVIEQSYLDGIRIYLEHGPGSSFSRAIRAQLKEREALVIHLDRRNTGAEGVLQVAAQLIAHGVDIDLRTLHGRMRLRKPKTIERAMQVPAHWPDVKIVGTPSTRINSQQEPKDAVWRMPRAPRLPPTDYRPPQATALTPTQLAVASRVTAVPPQAALPVQPVQATSVTRATLPSVDLHTQIAQNLHQQMQQLSALQTQYISLQTQAQTHFLKLRERAVAQLLAADNSLQPATGSTEAAIDLPIRRHSELSAGLRAIEKTASVPSPAIGLEALQIAKVQSAKTEHAPPPAPESTRRKPFGLQLSREQLKTHASGLISQIFGPEFRVQDGFARQVRMPEPPLLLADRVLGIDATPHSMGKGTIWTETDVSPDSWYLHHGRMPAGVMIEAGQADLMLISYVGIDNFNRSERIYRLLGCELTYHGDLPKVGETLHFEITLDGHAAQGDIRLMFFHYQCFNGDRPQLTVRKGQAGFFTDQELADSAGCLWSSHEQNIGVDARVDAPGVPDYPRSLTRTQLNAFAAGNLRASFGEAYRYSQTHTRTPRMAGGDMLLFDRVTDLSADGGPWQRGYLRAELDIDSNAWFFKGHFRNDPCMPGTLMFEACLQAMGLYQAVMGYTLKRDGWRFQPVPDVPYQLQCRGQVTPRSKTLVTELFIEERHDGPTPTLFADLLCTVDGLKAFHARRIGVQLVPDWPFMARSTIAAEEFQRPVASVEGFRFDQCAVLAAADGKPSEAFGPMYQRFDGLKRVARLPSQPYHFISRIRSVEGAIGLMQAGAKVCAEYDIPDQAWYFDCNGNRAMPFAVMLEAALQPCGWLASFVGSALTQDVELCFRNLDGDGELLGEIFAGGGTLLTDVTLTGVSASGGMIIQNFDVHCHLQGTSIYRLKTVFGFFPEAALANQAGLPKHEAQQALQAQAANKAFAVSRDFESMGVPSVRGMLRMIDRIEVLDANGGTAGLGAVRAAKEVDTNDWFFKAHFFQDPVQPGSLGLEAMVQTLMCLMQQKGLATSFHAPRFEALALNRKHQWKYRGQVLPKHTLLQTTLEITELHHDESGVVALALASLWVDGARIYEARDFGVRIVEARAE